jgi:hypothetical protein
MTHGECGAMLAIAGRIYGKSVNLALVDVWHEFMASMSAEEGVRAMKRHVVESPHFPTVADICRLVREERLGPQDAAEAWEEVRRAFGRCGRDREPTWSTPAIAGAVEAIGWRELCNTLDEDLPTVRAQFERYFKARLETQAKQQRNQIADGEQKRLGPKSVQELMREQQGAMSKFGGDK